MEINNDLRMKSYDFYKIRILTDKMKATWAAYGRKLRNNFFDRNMY
uniref:Uncharacterized protein n=1 Tax=Lepeophtheirus salmonis TaxID=72036 RepID=A0A0K2V5M1_LEPSM